MPRREINLISRRELRDYIVTVPERFRELVEVRALALAAAGMVQWVEKVKAQFSHPTATRYLNSLYWDPSDVNNIRMGVIPKTLAALLEFGEDPGVINPSVLLKGRPYRVIPIEPGGVRRQTTETRYPFIISTNRIERILKTRSSGVSKYIFRNSLSQFEKSGIRSRSYRERPRLLKSDNQKFITVKPGDTWKHPGIKAALIGHGVSGWMESNRSTFTSDLFQGDAKFIINVSTVKPL